MIPIHWDMSRALETDSVVCMRAGVNLNPSVVECLGAVASWNQFLNLSRSLRARADEGLRDLVQLGIVVDAGIAGHKSDAVGELFEIGTTAASRNHYS